MLSAALRVADGGAQVVSLVAQAGVGKSRLVDAVLERLRGAAGFEQATVRRVVSSSVGPRPYGLTAGLFVEGYGIGPADSLELRACKGRARHARHRRWRRRDRAGRARRRLHPRPAVGRTIERDRARAAQAPDRDDVAHGARAPPREWAAGARARGPAVGRRGVDRSHPDTGRLAVRAPVAGRADGSAAVRPGRARLRPRRA